jgi:hypothetical protein
MPMMPIMIFLVSINLSFVSVPMMPMMIYVLILKF